MGVVLGARFFGSRGSGLQELRVLSSLLGKQASGEGRRAEGFRVYKGEKFTWGSTKYIRLASLWDTRKIKLSWILPPLSRIQWHYDYKFGGLLWGAASHKP